MSFILRRKAPYVFALFPIKFFDDNEDKPDPKTIEKYTNKDLPNETGKDRLRRMFLRE